MNRPSLTTSGTWIEPDSGDTVSLQEIFVRIFDRRRLIAAMAVLFGLLGFLYVGSIVDEYTASTEIMLNPQRERVLASEEILPSQKPDAMAISTQVEIIESRVLAEHVVDTFLLAEQPDWNGEVSRKKGIVLLLSRLTGSDRPLTLSDEQKFRNAVEKVLEQTSAQQMRSSLVISIRATAPDPDLASDIANELRSAYIESQSLETDQASNRAQSWFSQRLEKLGAELRDKEAAVAAYRESNDLIETSGTGSTLNERQVLDAQSSVAQARALLVEKEAMLDQVLEASNSEDRLAEIGLAVGSLQVAELRRKLADSSASAADLSVRFGPQHPEMVRARAEISNIRLQIQQEIARIIQTMRDDVEVARARLKFAEQNRLGFETQLVNNNRSLVRLRELERDAKATKEIYEDYARRAQEVSDQASLGVSDTRLISAAIPPSRSDTPSRALATLASMILGGLLGICAAAILYALDDTLHSKKDVDAFIGKPVCGLVPRERLSFFSNFSSNFKDLPFRERLSAHKMPTWDWMAFNRMSRFGEAFRQIQNFVFYTKKSESAAIVAVNSAIPDEGKTTVSICLARTLAMSGHKTLLIDGDTRVRGVTRALSDSDKVQNGLRAAIAPDADYTTFLLKDPKSSAAILPTSESDREMEDIFVSSLMKDFLGRVAKSYDVIVIDSPPILAMSDATLQSRLSSLSLLVVRSGVTPARLALAAVQQVEENGGRIDGVVLNCVRQDSMGLNSSKDRKFYRHIQNSYYQK